MLAADPAVRPDLVKWEHVADDYIAQSTGFTAMCAYSAELTPEALADVAAVHPFVHGTGGATAVPDLLRRRPHRAGRQRGHLQRRPAGAGAGRVAGRCRRRGARPEPRGVRGRGRLPGPRPVGARPARPRPCRWRSVTPLPLFQRMWRLLALDASPPSRSPGPQHDQAAGNSRRASSTRPCSTAGTTTSSPACCRSCARAWTSTRSSSSPSPGRGWTCSGTPWATTPAACSSSTWPRSGSTPPGSSGSGPPRWTSTPWPAGGCAASASRPSPVAGRPSSSSASCTNCC